MIPNHEQQEFIKGKLLGRFKCRETYEELYDHVLTALEGVSDDAPFFDAVNNIIENDLGGAKAIKSIEAKYFKIAIKESIADYFRCFRECLTSFLILPIIALTTIYYWLMQYEWFNAVIGQCITQFIFFIPASIILANKLNAHTIVGWGPPKMDYAKSSVKPFSNGLMGFFPLLLWSNVSIVCMKLQRVKLIPNQADYNGMPINVATILCFIVLVHAVTYYKLNKDWHKKIIASFK
jgi:hypothetical protein